jgi:hypothetical protein
MQEVGTKVMQKLKSDTTGSNWPNQKANNRLNNYVYFRECQTNKKKMYSLRNTVIRKREISLLMNGGKSCKQLYLSLLNHALYVSRG